MAAPLFGSDDEDSDDEEKGKGVRWDAAVI
jgi:hypothetical protein